MPVLPVLSVLKIEPQPAKQRPVSCVRALIPWSVLGCFLVCATLSDATLSGETPPEAPTTAPAAISTTTSSTVVDSEKIPRKDISGSELELMRFSAHPGTTMSDGSIQLRGLSGQHDAGRLSAPDGSVVVGGALVHETRRTLIFRDGFESGDLQNWTAIND